MGEGKGQVAARGRPGLPGKDFIVLTGCATPCARGASAEAKSVMGADHTWSRIVFLAMHTSGSLFKVTPHLRPPQWTQEVSLTLRVPLPSVATVSNTLFSLLSAVNVRSFHWSAEDRWPSLLVRAARAQPLSLTALVTSLFSPAEMR